MAYCKKCKQEVEPAAICPQCGQKLTAASTRLSWVYQYAPFRDFLSWNGILRVGLPALALLFLVVLGVELIRKGPLGVQTLLAQGFIELMLVLTATLLVLVLMILMYKGRVEARYVLDHKGAHVQLWQVRPPWIRRLFHRMSEAARFDDAGDGTWMMEEKHLSWAALKRVGVWPDRDKILLYNPRFFMTLALHCLPENYDDSLRYIYSFVKKRPDVMQMPPEKMEEGHLPQM